jgi:uncharacterized protein
MLGTIAAIHRYPVKAMLGESLNAAMVATTGLAGDRAYALIDNEGRIGTPKIQKRWGPVFRSRSRYIEEPNGHGLTAAEITLPDGQRVQTSDEDIDARFSELLGFEAKIISDKPPGLKLESPPLGQIPASEDEPTLMFPVVNGFFDLGSLHLLTTGTLNKLRSLNPDVRFDPRRFRPNFIIDTDSAVGFVENDWVGRTIEIGDEVRIKVMMPTVRCVVTTLPQDDLPNEPGVLKTAAAHNSANVGIYALVEQGGMVRRGDQLHFAD